MRLKHIEKSRFRSGQYIGHCHGVQAIVRGGQGWRTDGLRSSLGRAIHATASTLGELDAILDAILDAEANAAAAPAFKRREQE